MNAIAATSATIQYSLNNQNKQSITVLANSSKLMIIRRIIAVTKVCEQYFLHASIKNGMCVIVLGRVYGLLAVGHPPASMRRLCVYDYVTEKLRWKENTYLSQLLFHYDAEQ